MKITSPLQQLVITREELGIKEQIRKGLLKQDPNLKEDDAAYKAAVVLLLLAHYGHADIQKLVRISAYEHEFVTTTLQNIARGGLYKNGKVVHSGWFDKESGGMAFWLDVAVARGLLERTNVNQHKCAKCKHEWVQRRKKKPKVCPKCKTELWEAEP